MKANLSQREPEFVNYWSQQGIYQKMQSQDHQGKFILNDGPPYANGSIHIGHSVNKILKDFIVKSQHLSGNKSPYIPGWDCHGLPIEVQIEKKFGRGKLTNSQFRQKCREYAQKQMQGQLEGFKRLGVLADWEQSYLTMQPSFEANIVKQFLSMVDSGVVSHGLKPVHWCPHCQSALSDAETEFADKTSQAIDVAFKLPTPLTVGGQTYESFVVIWTTTPWTIPANQAVAYSKEIAYSAVVIDNKAYVLADSLISSCLEKWGIQEHQVESQISLNTDEIENIKWAQHPLYDRLVPVVSGHHVTDDSGTGFVHVAPDHGPDDYIIGKEHNLIPMDLLDDRGRFKEGVEDLAGQVNFKAEENVINALRDKDRLLACHEYQHSYPVCWRHKKPIFFRTTPQWFVKLTKALKSQLINEAKKVNWHPDWGLARMEKMIESRPDWCISRQRFWGTPLVLIYDKHTYQLHPNMQEIGKKVVAAIEKDGIEAWFNSDLSTWGVDNKESNWVQSFDTLDVWFDSGSVFHLLNKTPLSFPADLYLEGSDQYRGWFQSSLINSVSYQGQAPYKSVLTHGMVVDSHGKKMSKSVGNVVEPENVAQKYGIDILRLWVAMSDYREELAIGDEILNRTADVYRRLRNTLRFLLGNLNGFDNKSDLLPMDKCAYLDRYILEKLAALQENNIKAYKEFKFDTVARNLIDFAVNDLGASYLDIIKDRLYTSHENSQARRSAQSALYYLCESLLLQLAPILSFTAEDAWQHWSYKKSESVFLNQWPETKAYAQSLSQEQRECIEAALSLKKEIQYDLEKLRQNSTIGSALEAHCHLKLPKNSILSAPIGELPYILLVSKVTYEFCDSETISWDIHSLAEKEKCVRCWFRVELDAQGVCSRCRTNIESNSETRVYG